MLMSVFCSVGFCSAKYHKGEQAPWMQKLCLLFQSPVIDKELSLLSFPRTCRSLRLSSVTVLLAGGTWIASALALRSRLVFAVLLLVCLDGSSSDMALFLDGEVFGCHCFWRAELVAPVVTSWTWECVLKAAVDISSAFCCWSDRFFP